MLFPHPLDNLLNVPYENRFPVLYCLAILSRKSKQFGDGGGEIEKKENSKPCDRPTVSGTIVNLIWGVGFFFCLGHREKVYFTFSEHICVKRGFDEPPEKVQYTVHTQQHTTILTATSIPTPPNVYLPKRVAVMPTTINAGTT